MRTFDTGQPIQGQIGVFSRTRPLRVAFLLADDSDAHETLDAIFSYSYGRWGGKRNLIVPVTDGEISNQYWAWLSTFDPDVVYSYCSLSDSLVSKIGCLIQPFQFTEHRTVLAAPTKHPSISVTGLSCFSVLPYLLARPSLTDDIGPRVLAFYEYHHRDAFIADSFGGDPPLSPSISPALKKLITPVGVVTTHERPAGRARLDCEVVGAVETLQEMTHQPTLTLAQLSGIQIPHDDFGYQHWSSGLNIVVGDTFVDRVSFWNGRLLVRPVDDRGFSALRIPASMLNDSGFIEALCRFLNRSVWQLPGGASNRPIVNVRSHSVSLADLGGLVDQIRQVAQCPTPPPEQILGIDTCCPAGDRRTFFRGMLREEHRQYVSNTVAHIEVPAPPHLTHIDPADKELLYGCWMVERKIERHNQLAGRAGQWWCLPKRLELAQSFIVDATQTTSRIIDGGLLGHTATDEHRTMLLRLPDDDEVFSTILYRGPFFGYSDRRHDASPNPISSPGGISDKGRYLIGATGRFGGLWEAYNFIESRFWRGIFSSLAGLSKPDQVLIKSLEKRLGKSGVLLSSKKEWNVLASIVASAARQMRFSRRYARFDPLYELWLDDLASFLSNTPHLHSQIEEIFSRAVVELEESLSFLCVQGVFIQGREIRCEACGNRTTFSVDTLSSKPTCSLCGKRSELPVRFDWHFFFDSFLAESIREHGLLPQIWALGYLLEQSRDCFLYLPPLKIKLAGELRPRELDLLCILDGKLVIGEVKQTWGDFRTGDEDSLCKLAVAIEPEIVVLACLENRTPPGDLIQRMREALKGVECEVRPIAPRGRFFEGAHYLPR